MREADFQSSDGLRIIYRAWVPASAPRAVVVINHGFNAHGGQQAWAAEELTKAGFAVYAHDMRGRGKSDGKRFFVRHVNEHTSDLHQMIKLAKQDNPGLPVFLLGHSAGGVVSCTYALDHQDELAGLICESFAFQLPVPGFLLSIIKFVARFAPALPMFKLKMKDFSRDPAAVAALLADPLTKNETQPAATGKALVEAAERLRVSFDKITLPVFIIHGTEDHATMYQGSQFFYDHAGSSDKTLKLYEGHFHDLLNDYGKEDVLADIRAWIEARVP